MTKERIYHFTFDMHNVATLKRQVDTLYEYALEGAYMDVMAYPAYWGKRLNEETGEYGYERHEAGLMVEVFLNEGALIPISIEIYPASEIDIRSGRPNSKYQLNAVDED